MVLLSLLESAHQDTKQELADIRKQKATTNVVEKPFKEITDIPYRESYFHDKDFRAKQKEYYDTSEKVESQWSVLYNLKAYTGPNADKYIELCRLNIQQFLEMDQLGKKFKDYETPISVRAYKRLSMIYEKQGNYENAFEICIEAIKNGIEYDGTKSGFNGRAARMIKKSGITPDEETVNILMQ